MNGTPLQQQMQPGQQVGPMAMAGAQQLQKPDLNQIRQQIQQEVASNPQLDAAINEAVGELLNDPDIKAGDIDKLIQLFEFAFLNPQEYPKLVQMLVAEGVVDEGELPPQYDPQVMTVMLGALYVIDGQGKRKGFARGGLARYGRGGDTMVAHISPLEAAILESYGGRGSTNPTTGLPEYGIGKFFKKIVKVFAKVAPILSFIPGLNILGAIGNFIGNTALGLGLGTVAQGALGGAILGGLTGGVKGAVLGGIGGYAGAGGADTVGGMVAPTAAAGTQQMIGAGLLGAGAGAITGQDPVKAGLTAGLTAGMTQKLGQSDFAKGLDQNSVIGKGFQGALQGANVAAQTGGDPMTGAVLGGVAGAGQSALQKMGFQTPEWMKFGGAKVLTEAQVADYDAKLARGEMTPEQYKAVTGRTETPAEYEARTNPGARNTAQYDVGKANTALQDANTKLGYAQQQVMGGAGGGDDEATRGINRALSNAVVGQADAQKAYDAAQSNLDALTPQQPAQSPLNQVAQSTFQLTPDSAFNIAMGSQFKTKQEAMQELAKNPDQRPVYDAMSNFTMCDNAQDFGACLASNWDTFNQSIATNAPKLKRGGQLRKLAIGGYAVGGPGDGQDDKIPAMLSDGEFVIPADVVSALGSGSTDAGAKALYKMMEGIRRDYRRAPTKKIPAKAKSPLQYLKGA